MVCFCRPSLSWSKVWYFEAFATSAVLYPLLNLYFRRIGLTATQIGILAAVRPWTSALAGNVWAVLGDYTGSHKTILMFTYVSTVLVRYCLGASKTFPLVFMLVLLTEALSAPILILADASSMAAGKTEGDYGKARMWGAVGWGSFSPLGGMLVSRYGTHAAFVANLIGGLLGIVPTALLPTHELQESEGTRQRDAEEEPWEATLVGNTLEGSPSLDKQGTDSDRLQDVCQSVMLPQSIPAITASQPADGEADEATVPPPSSAGVAASPFAAAQTPRTPSVRACLMANMDEVTHAHVAELLKRGDSLLDDVADFLPIAGVPELIDYDSYLLRLTRASAHGSRRGELGTPRHAMPSMWGSPRTPRLPVTPLHATPSMWGSPRTPRLPDTPSLQESPRLSLTGEDDALLAEQIAEAEEQLSIWQKLTLIFSQGEVVVFFVMTVLMGFAAGNIDGYMFLYLDQLGGPEILMGLTITVACVVELPVFHFMAAILRTVGVQQTLHWVMFFFLVRLGCYAMLGYFPSPWCVLPVETLNGITFGCAWAAGTVNCSQISPLGLEATTQAMFSASYMGLGLGLGGLFGGMVYNAFGPPATFAGAFVVILVGWVLCAIAQQVLRFSRQQPRSTEAADIEKVLLTSGHSNNLSSQD